jgi:hypothetical protein
VAPSKPENPSLPAGPPPDRDEVLRRLEAAIPEP